jgi:hypothetical protein
VSIINDRCNIWERSNLLGKQGMISCTSPIIDNRHLIVQNSSIITYFFKSISKINES